MEKTAGRRVYQKKRGQRAELGEREKRRLVQLATCLILFLVAFYAKGADKLGTLRTDLTQALGADINFRAAAADLSWSVAAGRPVGETLNELWMDVFLPREETAPAALWDGPVYQRAWRGLTHRASGLLAAMTGETGEEKIDPMELSGAAPLPPQPESTPEPEVVHVDYTGPALPENTSMDRYALGLSETVDPVLGVKTSDFGWRMHPIEEEEKFHYGVDLAVEMGTTVAAFAAGTVDYIGESDVYGQYLQLDHGNGVKSFYAHCSKLCVQQGQVVAMGEKVAESGETGKVTGPHLHFELKRDGVRLNPSYYIETLS